MTSPSTKVPTKYASAVAAIRDVHDEASLWHLSDELVKVAPSGVADVEAVVKAAKSQGIPTKSANTLRLYRDVAIRFPKSERVDLVSFSAHREAIAIGDVGAARKVLEDLTAKHGAAGVTVTTVKQAVAAATGKPSTSSTSSKSKSANATYADVAVDLSTNGGKAFIAELTAMVATNGVTLDGLHSGLTAVLAEVESRQSKAARKAAADKRKASTSGSKSPAAGRARKAASKPRKAAPRSKAAAGSKAGDLRDL